jgi:hypothetical protein
MNWKKINTPEDLPELDIMVLIAYDGIVTIGKLGNIDWSVLNKFGIVDTEIYLDTNRVTHWMHKPLHP